MDKYGLIGIIKWWSRGGLNSSLKTVHISVYMLRRADKFHLQATQPAKKASRLRLKCPLKYNHIFKVIYLG